MDYLDVTGMSEVERDDLFYRYLACDAPKPFLLCKDGDTYNIYQLPSDADDEGERGIEGGEEGDGDAEEEEEEEEDDAVQDRCEEEDGDDDERDAIHDSSDVLDG
jgi:hypothetical protein